MHKRKIGLLKPGLLSLGTMDVFAGRSCPVHAEPLDASSNSHPSSPPTEEDKKLFPDVAKCLLGPKLHPVENH